MNVNSRDSQAIPKLNKNEWEVRVIELHVAQRLVEQYHYSGGGSNTGVYTHGLFRSGHHECLGCAWWIPPTRSCAEASYDGDWRKVITLSRLAIAPDVPQNAASFLLGKSIRAIRRDRQWECLLTYADTGQGHTGAIYRATNWEYLGLTKPNPRFVDGLNRIISRKSGPKTRTRKEMAELGYREVGAFAKHKYRIILPPAIVKQPALELECA